MGWAHPAGVPHGGSLLPKVTMTVTLVPGLCRTALAAELNENDAIFSPSPRFGERGSGVRGVIVSNISPVQ
jgi:hypothetical protein